MTVWRRPGSLLPETTGVERDELPLGALRVPLAAPRLARSEPCKIYRLLGLDVASRLGLVGVGSEPTRVVAAAGAEVVGRSVKLTEGCWAAGWSVVLLPGARGERSTAFLGVTGASAGLVRSLRISARGRPPAAGGVRLAGERLGRKTDRVPVLPSKRSLRPARPEGVPTGRMATLRISL